MGILLFVHLSISTVAWLEPYFIPRKSVLSSTYDSTSCFSRASVQLLTSRMLLFAWFHAALALMLKCAFLIFVILLDFNIHKVRVMVTCSHEFDVALCGIKLKKGEGDAHVMLTCSHEFDVALWYQI